MKDSLRTSAFAAAALLFGGTLLFAMAGLPSFGHYRGPYGDVVLAGCIPQRHTPQGVAAVTFDYRGFDTLGEEFILFAAVAGSLLLMRPQKGERHRRQPADRGHGRRVVEVSEAVRAAGLFMFPFAFVLGCYVIAHGHLTPGGGFQGGALLASAFYFVYLSGEYGDLLHLAPEPLVEHLEVSGAAGFALIASSPVIFRLPLMLNILPQGSTGELISGGFLPLYNGAVGMEVGAAFLLLMVAFLKQVLSIRKEKR